MRKLAVVTGAASGFGLEFSKLLAKDSYDLILNDIDGINLRNVADILRINNNITVRTIVLDLGKKGAARKFYSELGPDTPDILINNAGFGLRGEFVTTRWDLEEAMIFLHIITPTYLTKLVLNDMLKRGSGKILIMSSVSAFMPGPLMAIYYATKRYLLSFGSAIASEVKKRGVSVTTICPGLTDTGFAKKVAEISNTSQAKKHFYYSTPADVARASYKALQRGHLLCFPGMKSKIMRFILWLMPSSVSINLIRKAHLRLE